MTRPCTAVRGHRGKLVGEGDVDVVGTTDVFPLEILYHKFTLKEQKTATEGHKNESG